MHGIEPGAARVAMTRAPLKVIYDPPLRTILVAGGDGFVGRAFCRLLASDGALRVICIDRYGPAGLPRETGNFRAIATEIDDRALVAGVIAEERIDTIVDLTGQEDPALADTAAACWAPLHPRDRELCRFISVAAGDASTSPKLATPLVRAIVATTYGPGQPADAFIPRTILAALAGRPIWVDPTGLGLCDWLHVEDHATALLTLVARGQVGATYYVGARQAHGALATVAMICDLIDRIAPRADGRKHRSLIRFGGAALRPAPPTACDPARIERELGWRAQIGFREGLIDTIDWYRHRARAERSATSAIA